MGATRTLVSPTTGAVASQTATTSFVAAGAQSIASGAQSIASGVQSIASGVQPIATGVQAIAAFFTLLFASRILGLTHQSLWFDEGYTVALATAPSLHDFWLRFAAFTTSEHLQPLYYLFIFLWSRIAGTSDFALRLPSALFALGSAAAVWYAIGRLTLGEARDSIQATGDLKAHESLKAQGLGVLALTLSSYSLYYAQEARPYALVQMLSFVVLAAWLRARSHAPYGRLSLAAASAASMLASPFAVLLVVSLAATELALALSHSISGHTSGHTTQRPSDSPLRSLGAHFAIWWHTWGPALAASATVLAAYLTLALATMPTFIAKDITALRQPLWMNLGYAIYGISFGTTLPPSVTALHGADKLRLVLSCWPVVASALLVLVALSVACADILRRAVFTPAPPPADRIATHTATQTATQAAIKVMALTALAYPILLFGFFGAIGHLNVLPRHSSALFALLLLTIAACAARSHAVAPSRTSSLFAAALAGWVLLNLVSIVGYWHDPAFRKDDYREAALLLHGDPAPTFTVSGQPMLLARYGTPTLDATSAEPGQLQAFIRSHAPQAPTVKLVFNSYRSFRWQGLDATLEASMQPGYRCRITDQLANIQIDTCTRLHP